MMKDGNWMFGDDHFVVCTDVELYCTPETHNVIYQFYPNYLEKGKQLYWKP